MKLSLSVEVLTDLLGEGPYFDPELRREAVQLGIEALKLVNEIRNGPFGYTEFLLPGETKE